MANVIELEKGLQVEDVTVSPLRTAIIGMGGYAGSHQRQLLQLESKGTHQLICSCDPVPEKFAGMMQEWCYQERGVQVYTDYREMLAEHQSSLDLVAIPTPINLHAEMHAFSVEQGIAVYLEKPPTLDHEELERMIANDEAARFSSIVGFSLVYGNSLYALKERLIAGEFGAVQEVNVLSLRPRACSYFVRAPWAGKLILRDELVLDSVLGNASAHKLHEALFLAGCGDLHSRGSVDSVEAELYRAHAIEGADTFFVRATNTDGVTIKLAMSHACAAPQGGGEVLDFTVRTDKATLYIGNAALQRVEWNDGSVEECVESPPSFATNHEVFAAYLRGSIERPTTTLTDCRSFVQLYNLTYVSADSITSVHDVMELTTDEGKCYVAIKGIQEASKSFINSGLFPSEQGECNWAASTGPEVVQPADLPRLRPAIDKMVRAVAAESR